jgi:hypothetical protein
MKRRNFLLLLPVWVLAAALLAFLLRDVVFRLFVVPMVYLLWVLGLVYRAIPQSVLWIALVTVALLTALSVVLRNVSLSGLRPRQKTRKIGPVQELAQTINSDARGVYFKWQVARTLAEIALKLQELHSHSASRTLQFDERDPLPEVRRYLNAGLGTSFADYPLPRLFQFPQKTPFDMDLDPVLAYLESQTELDNDRRRS